MTFRFRPRHAAFPWILVGLSAWLIVCVPLYHLEGSSRTFAIACGVIGPLVALAYWRSPAWRLVVEVDDDALTVRRGADVRMKIAWREVVEVVHSSEHMTALVDGGASDKRLLVPGPDAPGPYRIERREALVREILARVPADKQRESPRPGG
jgi:hypothetical protein